jgi:glycosyltransferase involved in cell wall biosynthesis
MPVFNGEKTLKVAIESVLYQTYSNFELIIIDDGSQDQSLAIIRQFSDKRIRSFSQTNSGLAKTLNVAILHSNGDLIARQDQDDISMSTRIEKQVKRFNQNRDLVLLGTRGHIINDQGEQLGKIKVPIRNMDLKYLINFNNPFIHTSVMMRTKVLKEIGGYSEDSERQPPEDFELWGRIKELGEIENLKECLVKYRLSVNSMSRKYEETIALNYKKIVVENLQKLFPFSKTDAIVFFDLQFLPQTRYGFLVKINLTYKFILGFVKIQLRHRILSFILCANFLKMIIRICLK